MRHTRLLIAVAVALAMLVAVPAMGLAASGDAVMDQHDGTNETQADETNQTDANETAEEGPDENATAPGERLSGVVGVQQAELEGDVDQRTFGIRVAQSASEDAQADVVANQLGDVEQRLANLTERKAELEAEREAGNISEGKYRAEIARTAAETRTVKQLTNQSADVASGLPTALLEERGVNAERITHLKNNASELTGPEVAEIARGIAGQGAGQPPVDTPAPDVGPPENETDDRPRGPPESGDQSDGEQATGADNSTTADGQDTTTTDEQDSTDQQDGRPDNTQSDESPGQSGY